MSRQTTRESPSILVALAFCMALALTGFAMFIPLFALRFDSFGAGVKALGTSDMAYALTFAFAAPFIGMLADRFGRRPILLVSLAGYLLVYTGYLLATAAWPLILLRGLAGIFAAGLLPGMTTIVGDLAPESRRAQWIGIVNGGAAAGYIIGPLLGGLLYDRFGYVAPSAVSITMAAAALLLATLRIPETYTPAAHPGHLRSTWKQGWQALPTRSTLLLLMFITFGVMFAFAFVQPQFMFYAYDELSWTSSQLGLVMSAYAVAFMVGAFALGQLSDRIGRKPALLFGLALFSVQFVGLLVFHKVTWIVMSFAVAGLGNAIYDPALSAAVLDIISPEQTAGIMGLKAMAGSLGSVLGPGLVVLFTPWLGPQVVFLAASTLVMALALASALALHVPQRALPRTSGAAVTR
jgi:MFS family permease